MQVIGNYIYFISLRDDNKIIRIDVNGQNRQILSNKDIDDMAVHNENIYYSYETKDDVYLELMNIDGSEKQLLSNIKTRNMIVDDEYIYYLDDYEEALYRMNLNDKSIEKLSNKVILKFIKDDKYIFYTLKNPNDKGFRFMGLYRMNLDGSNVVALGSDSYLDELSIGVTEDYVFYTVIDGQDLPGLKIINKDGKEVGGIL